MAARASVRSKTSPVPGEEEQIQRQSEEQTIPMEERIRRRAYEIYLQNGGENGSDVDHWLQAEKELLLEQGKEL